MCAVQTEDVFAKIGEVLDPELDQPLLDLGFIDQVEIEGGEVRVSFRLPTYWCAPNFAFLMAADLQQKVREVDGVESVHVCLADHFADGEINQGINDGRSFRETFPGEAAEELDDLRRTFTVKAFLVRQEQLIRLLRKAGCRDAEMCDLRVGGIAVEGDGLTFSAPGPAEPVWRMSRGADAARSYLQKRAALDLDTRADARLFTDSAGNPIDPAGLDDYLRHSQAIRLNMAFNTMLCSGLLQTRYRDAAGESHPGATPKHDPSATPPGWPPS